jgi:hypothetical protein
MWTHAPVPDEHDSHDPLHVLDAQQKPLLQTLEPHCASSVHAVPAASSPVQLPFASHVAPPVHESGSCWFLTGVHVPLPDAHAVHAPVHVDCEQQKPLLQTPTVHCASTVHAPPGNVCGVHALEALQ